MTTPVVTMALYRKARKRLLLHATLVQKSFERIEASAKSLQALIDELDDNRFGTIAAIGTQDEPLSSFESADQVRSWLAEACSELDEWQEVDSAPPEE